MVIRAVGVVAVLLAVVAVLLLRRDEVEQIFTVAETEAAFDAAGVEVEPSDSLSTFLKPTGDKDFIVTVFENTSDSKWSYDELQTVSAEVAAGMGFEEGYILRHRNVLVYSDRGTSEPTRRKVELALAHLAGRD